MSHYSRKAEGLTQAQAFENLKAVLNSDYFKTYEFYMNGSRIISDVIEVNAIINHQTVSLLNKSTIKIRTIIISNDAKWEATLKEPRALSIPALTT